MSDPSGFSISVQKYPPVEGMFVGVEAPSRDALLQAIDGIVANWKWQYPDATYLPVELPCGQKRYYKRREDVPATSERCECGTLEIPHYFVRYTDEEASRG